MKNGIRVPPDSYNASKYAPEIWTIDGKLHSRLHRTDGPSIIYSSGRQHWQINDNTYYDYKTFGIAAGLTDEEIAILFLKYGSIT